MLGNFPGFIPGTATVTGRPEQSDRQIAVLNRRAFIVSAAAGVCIVPLVAAAQEISTPALERSPQFEVALRKVLAAATPIEGKITLELPEVAENGNFVPLILSVDSPMSTDDYVKAIHVLSTANPVALVAVFHLTPVNAQARVQSRMRLAKTQDIIAIAEMSDGSFALATALVKVTIGGCAS